MAQMTSLNQFKNFIDAIIEGKAGTVTFVRSSSLNGRVQATIGDNAAELSTIPLEIHELKGPISVATAIIKTYRERVNSPPGANLLLEVASLPPEGSGTRSNGHSTVIFAFLEQDDIGFSDWQADLEVKALPPVTHNANGQVYMAPAAKFLEAFLNRPGNKVLVGVPRVAIEDCFLIDHSQPRWLRIGYAKIDYVENWRNTVITAALDLYSLTNDLIPDLSTCDFNQINRQVGTMSNLPPELSNMVADKLRL